MTLTQLQRMFPNPEAELDRLLAEGWLLCKCGGLVWMWNAHQGCCPLNR